jgi:uncharacterized protein (DUF2336 family)
MAAGVKNWLKKAFGLDILPSNLSYENARAVLEKHNRTARMELAERRDAPPEMLYYLSEDEIASVRAAVAANPATPIQASERLVDDPEADVRAELARRIGRLVPGADLEMQADLRDRVLALIEKLAADKLPRVRAIIAEEIKAADNVPRHVVQALARDTEITVCGPVLEYSPLLSDVDLMELVAGSAVEGAAKAIAQRSNVSEDLAAAIANTLDIPAVTALLANPNVLIREDTLDLIITEAAELEILHEPLVMRPNLSLRAIRHIASFVARSLLEDLVARSDLDKDTEAFLRKRVLERVEEETTDAEKADKALADIRRAHKEGKLNDKSVTRFADLNERENIALALSLLASQPAKKVQEILDSKSPEAVTALCWCAGLSMRTAHAVQKAVRIPHDAMLLPKGGFDYPMTDEKMRVQLAFFDIKLKA